jgi:uncharacterized membrane protein YccC
MSHHSRRALLSRISELEYRVGIRVALSAVLAMVAGRLLGLHAFYWAGISAIVVSTGTPGGSFTASLMRFGGTMVGLAFGVLSVWILGHTLLAAALAIPLAIMTCQAVGLKPSVKVAALSTLFPIMLAAETYGLSITMETVLSRAENVFLGCLVTLLIDGLIWPERVTAKCLGRIQTDVIRVGRLASDLLEAYLTRQDQPLDPVLLDLQTARLAYSEMLKEMGLEPEDREAPRDKLASQTVTLHMLVDHCAALRDIQRQAREDQAQLLLREELAALSAALLAATEAFGRGDPEFRGRLALLRAAGLRLETAYEGVRGEKGTQAFPSQEIFRLLGVLYLCGALVRGLNQFAGDGGEAVLAVQG